jgi:hypothetical protein
MRPPLPAAVAVLLCAVWPSALDGRPERPPSARLVRASRIVMPGAVDSNVPLAWDLVDGRWRLFALTSWGGLPARHAGPGLDQMQEAGPVAIVPHPGYGVWIESIVPDENGAWYGYYHHERDAVACGRADRFVPRLGAVRSTDRGATWQHLGFILEAAADTNACQSTNTFVLGGVGDVSAVLDRTRTNLFLYFSQYPRSPSEQGIAVARLAWADRDAPVGRVTIWRDGAWLPGRPAAAADRGLSDWISPMGTPLVAPTRPWHDGQTAADVFWGPSIHWNRYLERYVMLMNRAANEQFGNEGIYVSFAARLDEPRGWSTPRKILGRGGWYPQVAGLEPATGTDREAGQRARFLLTGRSDYFIEFQK